MLTRVLQRSGRLVSPRLAAAAHSSRFSVTLWSTPSASTTVNPHGAAAAHFSTTSSYPPKCYPQYNVRGPSCMMSVKLLTPSFRLSGQNLVIDHTQRGKILLEFSPRSSEGRYDWENQIRFALSAEEVGLMCSQLPNAGVELSRSPYMPEDAPGMHNNDDRPEKVLKVEPGPGATVEFTIDYIKDGIGGQGEGSAPLSITVQAGEFEVLRSILQTSLPSLVGWTNMMEICLERSIQETIRGEGTRSPPTLSGSDVPF